MEEQDKRTDQAEETAGQAADPPAESARQAEALAQAIAEGKEPEETKTTIKLSRPVTLTTKGPKETTLTTEAAELTFDWDSLTGADHTNAARRSTALGWTVVLREYTPPYLTYMAVSACTLRDAAGQRALTYEAIERLPLRDAVRIQDAARNFLLRGES